MTERSKEPVSVVILAKNEAGRIRDCIESALWADEVLVIDDESTDETVRIAESLGARVLCRKMDIEGRHRNWAHAQAKHEWILSLDSDERVTPELACEIAGIVQGKGTNQLYAIPRRNYIGSRWIQHGGWYPSAQLKLFKRSIFRWEETTVHPRAISEEPAGTLTKDLIHYSYRDLTDFVAKMNRQTTLEAEKWLRDGRKVPFGKALWRTADRCFRSYIGKSGWKDGFWGWIVAVLAGAYQMIAWAKYTEAEQGWRIEDVVAPFEALTVDEERYDRSLLMSHLCAYRLAGRLGRGSRVLEIGCGSGYGGYYLGHVARNVTAVDRDVSRIKQACDVFKRRNVVFQASDGRKLDFPNGSFDCVGTFQVIEHIPVPELKTFLNEIARVLVPGGCLVVSTLNLDHNQKNAANYRKPDFHEKEFKEGEFRELLSSVFPAVEIYGLYPKRRYRFYRRLKKWGLSRWGTVESNPVKRYLERQLSTEDFDLRRKCDSKAIDLIGVCRTAKGGNGKSLI